MNQQMQENTQHRWMPPEGGSTQPPGATEGGAPADGQAGSGQPNVDRADILARKVAELEGTLQQFQRQAVRSHEEEQLRRVEVQFQAAIADRMQAVDAAERALTQAHSEGEPNEIAKAQRALAEAIAQKERVQAEYEGFKRQVEARSSQPEPVRPDDTNLRQWQEENPWYGKDPEMTAFAKEVAATLESRGDIPTGTYRYFEEINRQVRSRFPDRFDRNPGEHGSGAPSLASGRHEASSGGGEVLRMSESERKAMERFGMTPEQWKEARDKAVAKGILPPKKSY